MNDDPLRIRELDEHVTQRARRTSRSKLPWLVVGCVLLAMIIRVVMWVLGDLSRQGPDKPAEPLDARVADNMQADPPPAEVVDDGTMLWRSPTRGQPLELRYLPPGTRLVVQVRVADLLAHPEGQKVLAALGPWGESMVERISGSTGVALSDVEMLTLGVRPTASGELDGVLLLGLKSEIQGDELEPSAPDPGKVSFLPSDFEGRLLVHCSDETQRELEQFDGETPIWPRELARVIARTDQQRTVTVVFAGKFLQLGGEKLFDGSAEPLREALVDFLGDEATASAVSLHWGNDFFAELQSTVVLSERPHRFAAELEQRVAAAAESIEDEILREPRHEYGRKVLARFPAMLRKLSNYTRDGEVDGLSVLRVYLPVTAGHNLLTATELLLNMPPASRAVAGVGGAASPGQGRRGPREELSIDERLERPTSLVFPKETLEKALEMLAEDTGIPLEIAGRDLQLEGITKNQSFGLELRDQPAGEILLAVLRRANPDQTAEGPADPRQKLVFVVREATGDGPGKIVVTTRAAAARRGEELPAVFVAPGR